MLLISIFPGPQSQEQPPRHGIVAIDSIQHRRLRIERDIAADTERKLVRVPDVAHAAESVRADAKRRMSLSDTQLCAIRGPQQFVLVHQLKPRVKVVFVEKVHGRFSRVAVEVVRLARTARVIAAPDEGRRPSSPA